MRVLVTLIFSFALAGSLFAQNNGLYFDGNEEFLSIEHDDVLNIGEGFTIEAWIFAETWQDAIWQGSIAAKDGQSSDRGYAFRCGDNGSLSFVIQVDNVWEEAQSPQIMNANQWHHVAGVFDAGTITLYIDGQVSGTHTVGGSATHSPDLPLYIGGSPGFTGRHFHGAIDDVRIWNVARTANEIADNMTASLNSSEENLVVYLPMNEGTGEVANDLSGSGNSGDFNFMDSSNWVEGYTLPDFDISMQKVFGVDVLNMIDRPVKLKATVQNNGTEAISNVDLTVAIDGEDYNTETINETILAGDVHTHEFVLPLNLTENTWPPKLIDISVRASHPDDGNTLNNSKTLEVRTNTNETAQIASELFHNVGKISNSVNVTLPYDMHTREEVFLEINLSCPTGGCGDWDVLADLTATTEAGTFELARYITPYGIACGPWIIDITDFKSVLVGEVEFTSNIFVYTQTGWLVDMEITFFDFTSTNTFSSISPIWERSYHVYGDPNIDDDLPAVSLDVDDNTTASHVRMTITGHGQGNTNNAAEFFEVDHTLEADGQVIDTHHLWKDDCPDNPCADQAGSWSFPRAGWCPGQDVRPHTVLTTEVATPGSSISLDYELQDYTNLLNTGYNNSGHTEPYYKIYSYFVQSSDTPFESYANLETSALILNTQDNALTSVDVTVTNTGFEDLDQYDLNVFANGNLVATESYSEAIAVGAQVEKNIVLSVPLSAGDNAIFAEVVSAEDDNPGDNVTLAEVTGVGIDEIITEFVFDIFPNPTGDGVVQISYDKFWTGSTLKIFSTTGQALDSILLSGEQLSIHLNQGVYWYTIDHPTEGSIYTNKIISFK